MITRRALISSAATAAAVPRMLSAAAKPFPKGFLWGAATAGHQVEGNNLNSDCWLLEHLPESAFAEPSGDACDHYHLYPHDIHLLGELGFNTYRFSLVARTRCVSQIVDARRRADRRLAIVRQQKMQRWMIHEEQTA